MLFPHKISIVLLYFAALASLSNDLVTFSLYIALPASFLLSLYRNPIDRLFKNRYFKLLIYLYVWCAITSLFAINIDSSIRQFNQILGVILLFATIVNLSRNRRSLPWLYGLYIILAIAVIQYVRQNIFSIAFDVSTSRIGDDKLNTNTIAYYAFFLTCALYLLGSFTRKKIIKDIFSIAFLLMIPASFWIAIYTASRQVLLIQVPLITLLLYIKYFYGNKNIFKYCAIGIVIFAIAGSVFVDDISKTYDNSYLKQRSERNVEKDIRFVLMEQAIDVGLSNPIFGVGPGNFSVVQPQHMFSHCSYTELFANSGFPAIVIYIYIILSFPIKQYKIYRKSKNKNFLVFSAIGFIYFFYNFFYVFYIDLWLMSFFAVLTGNSLVLQKQLKTTTAV